MVAIGLDVVLVTAGTGCEECRSLLDCPFPQICSRDGVCVDEPAPLPPRPCEPMDLTVEDSSPLFDPTVGFLDGDTKWLCPTAIEQAGGVKPTVTAVEGSRVTVTGSLFRLKFSNSGDIPSGSNLIYGVERNSYFVKRLDDFGPFVPQSFDVEMHVRPFADGGDYDFYMGIDPGNGTQDAVKPVELFRTRLRVIGVQSGDIQVNVSWDTIADVDLHVFSPIEGEEVAFTSPTVPSGGQLDLDSNIACGSSSDERNENVVWPTGSAPDGEYRIHVNLYDEDCGFAVTNYRVVVVRELEVVQVVEGELTSAEAGTGVGELVTTVSWPPP